MLSNKPKIFALLVGINQYDSASSVTPLNGCVADIEATETLLKKYYGVASSNICKLTNAQATHQNIVAHFRSHLIDNASPDTTLLFWFSGHGSRQRTDPRFYKNSPEPDEKEKKDETLVCHDSRVKINGEMPNADLADKELAVLIDWAAQKGANVVTIFDSCHSGDVTRSDPDTYERTRLVEDRNLAEEELARAYGNSSNPPFSRSYLGGYYQKNNLDQVPRGKHLVLAACQYQETAKECTIEGNRRGIFSYYLQQAIAQNPAATYANLFEQVRSIIATESNRRQFSSPQTPQHAAYEDFDTHQVVFTQQRPKYLSNKHEVSYNKDKKEWRVKYGAQQGLPTSGKMISFDIYNLPTDQTPMTEAQIKKVNTNYSTLELEHKLSPYKPYWAVISQLEDVPIWVNLEADEVAQTQLNAFINTQKFTFFAIDNSQTHEFRVVITQGHWRLFKGKATTPLVNEPFTSAKVFSKLNRLGHWHLLRNNQNKNTKFKIPRFNFRIEDSNTKQKLVGKKAFQRKKFVCTLDEGDWILDAEIHGQNYQNKDLYFALLYFNSDYSIQIPYNKLVSADAPFVMDEQEFGIDKGSIMTTECIQIMVSTEKPDTHFLSQPALNSNNPDRFMRKKKSRADWCTVTMELNLVKK